MVFRLKIHFVSALLLLMAFSLNSYSQTDTAAIELNIFPNPNRGTFYITTIQDESYKAQLYTMNGELVKAIFLYSGLNYVNVDAPAGIYFLEVQKGEIQERFKIVIN